MPELPDVEVYMNYFEEHALQKEIKEVEVLDEKSLRNSTKEELNELLQHDSFKSVERYGKWLIIYTKKGNCIAIHFGMTGYLNFTEDDKLPNSTRIAFDFSGNKKLLFVDQRKFGGIEIVKDKEELIKEHKLGTDALRIKWNEFENLLKDKHGQIKTALMNQSMLSGLGNVYVDEILFQARIHPTTLVSSLTDNQIKMLYRKMYTVLNTAIKHKANPGAFPNNYLTSHRKKGKSWAACKGKVKTKKVGGRTTYFCPEVQI